MQSSIPCPSAHRRCMHSTRQCLTGSAGWDLTTGRQRSYPCAIVAASKRIRCALLGSEDLANDLAAERGPDALELDYARRRFLLDCRAARVEPIDAPYTFSDTEGAARETRYSRRLGYRSKALVRPEHAMVLNEELTPGADEIHRAQTIVAAFGAARARGAPPGRGSAGRRAPRARGPRSGGSRPRDRRAARARRSGGRSRAALR